MPRSKKTADETTDQADAAGGFSDVERAAMKERAAELRSSGRGGKKKADDLANVLAKIAEMPQPDRGMAERIHTIVTAVAPHLDPKTWYGMPAYADENGKVVCFFKGADKYDSRYATLGFEEAARLDDGSMWSTSYALSDLTDADATKIEALVARAVS
ncbi:DUF1801 domain-containing protein [Mumia sp. zg.B17]|uniref:iron chaperone n=1 Tax=Mumia sp. zg.B17 TaxID=2855446 RepID=UPI001C6ECFB5|nr:DUF1801 domain-containing protein [Mumia sp. zg.B17]MBW9207772.1 DUF1801 domain-containing protein [Mumia sp. zg.B17]